MMSYISYERIKKGYGEMKLGAKTIANMNREMMSNGLVALEDEIILGIHEDMEERYEKVKEIFMELIDFLNSKLSHHDLNYVEIFEEYKRADGKMDEIYNNEIFNEILEKQKEKMLKLNTEKNRIIVKNLMLGCGANEREIRQFVNLKANQQIKKFREIIIEGLEENDDKLLELNSIAFNLIEMILERLENEENNVEYIEIDLQIGDLKKYNYIPNWKDLERIAINKGFSYKSTNGSHRKLEHEKTRKCITIPMHGQMGLGISLKIQKQIDEKCR